MSRRAGEVVQSTGRMAGSLLTDGATAVSDGVKTLGSRIYE